MTRSSGVSGTARRLAAVAATGVVAAGVSRVLWRQWSTRPPGGADRWQRTNHRGEPITLVEGPVATLAAAGALALSPALPPRLRTAAVVAGLGAGAVGLLDDLAERGTSKGLRGHLGALRRGEVTTGTLKIVGIGASGMLAGALALPTDRDGGAVTRAVDLFTAGATVAGLANLVNLLDLRPGRALKVVALHAGTLAAPGPAGAFAAALTGTAAALLPEDLGERAMLGDCGANALGALIGTSVVAGSSRRTRTAALAGTVALILASERVSFTKVIESTPGLRALDALGRRPR